MEKDIKIPQHVAIILDGNGRWAKSKGMPRNYGHAQGAKTVETICREAWNMGIKYLTVYAFSTENWKRPQEEVDALMKLLRNYMKNCLKTAEKNHMRVRVIGDKTALAEDIRKSVAELEEASKDNDGLNFQIAINYGYYRYKYLTMLIAVILLIVIVQIFQTVGTKLTVRLDKRLK